jgi:hypothetical protein
MPACCGGVHAAQAAVHTLQSTASDAPPAKVVAGIGAVPASARAAVVVGLNAQMQHLQQQFQEVQQMMGQLQQSQ